MPNYRRLLEEKDRDLTRRIERFLAGGEADAETQAAGELSSYDNHPADLASETFEREKDLGLLGNLRRLQGEVREALSRLDRGEYGRCLRCGREIEEERLEAVPWAEFCRKCQEEIEGNLHRRPREEGAPLPDEAGREAWRALEAYGTSSDPGLVEKRGSGPSPTTLQS